MISWGAVTLVTAGVVAMHFSGIVSTVILSGCVVAALVGPGPALKAMMIGTLIAYGNPLLFPPGPAAGILLRVVLIVMALRVLPMMRGADVRLIWPLWLFSIVAALTSWIQSPALPISLMKIVTFIVATSAVLVAFRRLSPAEMRRIQTWFLSVGITVIAISGLTLVQPSVALGGDAGLQGVLNQPQALGIFIAPFAAWSLSGAFLMRRSASRLEIWFCIAALILIVITKARTAGFATIFALAVVVAARVLSGRRRIQARLGRPIVLACVTALVLGIVAFATGKVGTVLMDYAYKGSKGSAKDLSGAFYDSRGNSVLAQWQSFLNHPFTGNGFGVYPNGKFPVPVVYVAGIPISAPVEKGFLPSAELEEGGVPGEVTLLLVILWLARDAWRHPDLRWRALFCACLGVNIGECVFLSPGGIGMIDWLLLGLAVCAWRAGTGSPRLARPAPVPSAESTNGPPLAAVPGWWAT